MALTLESNNTKSCSTQHCGESRLNYATLIGNDNSVPIATFIICTDPNEKFSQIMLEAGSILFSCFIPVFEEGTILLALWGRRSRLIDTEREGTIF